MFQVKKMLLRFNNPETPINPIGIVIHETANPGDSAQVEHKYFNSGDRKASAHAFIDSTEIIQCIEWNMKAWHAEPTANSRYIGIELCHATSQEAFDIIYRQAVELSVYLLINTIGVAKVTEDNIMSHYDVSKKWNETDHEDPLAYFEKFGVNFEKFRKDVQNLLDAKKNYPPVTPMPKPKSDSKKLQFVTLKRGSRGKAVEEVQIKLKKLNLYTGVIDGDFGRITENAVRKFQNLAKIKEDGIIGVDTSSKLFS